MCSFNEKYRGKQVIIDTDSRWVYIGTFDTESPLCITLKQVDAFDHAEVSLSKHEYAILVKQDGIAPNRNEVDILKNKIIGITLLSNILDK
jgi:hypothetical protein